MHAATPWGERFRLISWCLSTVLPARGDALGREIPLDQLGPVAGRAARLQEPVGGGRTQRGARAQPGRWPAIMLAGAASFVCNGGAVPVPVGGAEQGPLGCPTTWRNRPHDMRHIVCAGHACKMCFAGCLGGLVWHSAAWHGPRGRPAPAPPPGRGAIPRRSGEGQARKRVCRHSLLSTSSWCTLLKFFILS